MAFNREAVWAALFALLKSKLSGTFPTMSRTHIRPPALALEYQPGLFLVQLRESRAPRPGGFPGKVTLTGFVIIYFQTPEPLMEVIGAETQCGATQTNNLLDAVSAALAPDDIVTGKLTLAGLVEHCWIEGDLDMDPGIYGAQGAAVIPVKMLASG